MTEQHPATNGSDPAATYAAQPGAGQEYAPSIGPAAGGFDQPLNQRPPYKLYVAGVPKNFSAEDLTPYFEKFGQIVSSVILVEKGGSGMSRGCAFVTMGSYEAANAAIAALDNQTTLPNGPYALRVRFAHKAGGPPPAALSEVDRRRLFFTKGPPGISEEAIKTAFTPYGDIEEVNMFPDRVSGTTKGCGFVTFASQEQAASAMAALNGQMQLEGVAQAMHVSWADPERRAMLKRKFGEVPPELEREPSPALSSSIRSPFASGVRLPQSAESKAQTKMVFFAKVPRAATETDVAELFARYGAVERVTLFKAAGMPHHKGCGLATFQDHQSACDAILALDGIYLWPRFTDPMVVKWMDRSMQKQRRPDGTFAPRPPQPQLQWQDTQSQNTYTPQAASDYATWDTNQYAQPAAQQYTAPAPVAQQWDSSGYTANQPPAPQQQAYNYSNQGYAQPEQAPAYQQPPPQQPPAYSAPQQQSWQQAPPAAPQYQSQQYGAAPPAAGGYSAPPQQYAQPAPYPSAAPAAPPSYPPQNYGAPPARPPPAQQNYAGYGRSY